MAGFLSFLTYYVNNLKKRFPDISATYTPISNF
jgi:hypothetical protein